MRLTAIAAMAFVPVGSVFGAIGRTPANFEVSTTGEAAITIPVTAPAGVHGLTPQLALVYGHRSGQSIAGAGWAIAGTSVIARCNSTVIQDGVARNVRNDLDDRFCLNGNKLRLITGTYGLAASEYRTEIETYSRIKAYGAAGNGPTHFIVEGKDGLIYEFGNSVSSRIESLGQSTARAWALNKIRDRDGNEIVFTYIEDATYGSFKLDLVSYAGNPMQGSSAIYSVDLVYEAKPAGEIDSGYIAGSRVKEIQRLDRIDVLHNGTDLYRRYELTYEASLSATSLSRLASVTECAGTASNCFPATTFTYQDGAPLAAEVNSGITVPNTPRIPLDVNGDGREDIVYSSATGAGTWMVMFANASGGYNTPTNTGVSNTGYNGAITIDYNSDGRGDLLVPYSGGTWWVTLGSASGLGALTNTGAPATATGTGTNARALDVDGDGRDDLVWADLTATSYAAGDAIRYRLRLSGSGFSATATNLVGPLAVDYDIPTGIFQRWENKMSKRAPDFNGDGREDIVYRHRMRINNSLMVNESSSQAPSGSTDPSAAAAGFNYFYAIKVACPGVTDCLTGASGLSDTPYFGDFNGDGKDDIFYWDEDFVWRYRFSTGTGFTALQTAGNSSAYGDTVIYDWDGDGNDDVLASHIATATWHVLRSTGESLLAPVSTGVPSSGAYTTDMNGDQLSDLVYPVGGIWKFRARAVTFAFPDLLQSSTDAFGGQAQFAYAPITSSTVYTKGTGAVFPEEDFQRPLWVVSTATATDGTGNNTNYTLNYTYETARIHRSGRGFLGFAKRNVVDSRLGYNVKTVDTYRQDYPYIGAPASRELRQSGGTRVSLTTNTWSNLSWGTAGSTQRNFPYVSTQSVDQHEVGGTLNGTKFKTTTTTVASGGIDSATGLVTDVTTTTTDVIGAQSKTERVWHSAFMNDTTNWCLGRPTESQVINAHTLPNGVSITRTFDAVWDGLKCRPTQQRAEPDNATWRMTVGLGYDGFGNVNSQTVTGAAMTARTTLTDWGSRGHFPASTTNALGHVTTYSWDPLVGLQSSETDPNGATTSWTYDGFARKASETRPDSTSTVFTYVTCTVGCDARDRYYILQEDRDTTAATVRTSEHYFNRWDVQSRARVQRLDTDYAYTTNRDFDARGRVSKEYVPYYSGSATNGDRRFTYDLLNRVLTDTQFTAAGTSDQSASYTYSGLSTTVTDALSHSTTRATNAWGEPLSVADAASGTMSHQYDAFGNLKRTTDAALNVVFQASYNVRGFRTQTIDMDLGTWSYTPNALGEVESQTDAKLQNTTFAYDLLGRMTGRTEPEGISTWVWGTSSASNNIGRLASLSGPGYSESFTYDSIGRPTSRTVTSDATYQFNLSYNNARAPACPDLPDEHLRVSG